MYKTTGGRYKGKVKPTSLASQDQLVNHSAIKDVRLPSLYALNPWESCGEYFQSLNQLIYIGNIVQEN